MSANKVHNKVSAKSVNSLPSGTQTEAIVSPIIEKELSQNSSLLKKVIPVNPEVKPKKQSVPRRSFDVAYKTRILAAYDACDDSSERGALLRREGLYYSRICAWRQQQANGKTKMVKGQKNAARIDHLISEVAQLKKKMAQAKAIIDIQKKVSDLLGMHIHSHEIDEMNS